MPRPIANVTLSPQAEDYLLRKRDELTQFQRDKIEKLLLEINANPYIGKPHKRQAKAAMGTYSYIERHIGESKHVRFHYDLVINPNSTIGVEIKSVWIGYLI